MKRLDREQATPQARTGVYCFINMMLGRGRFVPEIVLDAACGFGKSTKNQCFQSLIPL